MPMFSSGGSMYTSAAEEKSARLQIEKDSPFKATHTYNPVGMDAFDPRGVQGEPIASGSKIQLMKEHNKGLQQGMPGTAKKMFNVVRDEAGNMQHVSRSSMDNFHDRRGEGRRQQ